MNTPKNRISALTTTVACLVVCLFFWTQCGEGIAYQTPSDGTSSAVLAPPNVSQNQATSVGSNELSMPETGRQAENRTSDILPAANIAELFNAATKAFQAQEFAEANRLFEQLAKSVPLSELQIQCRYFACISAWNDVPDDTNLNQIEQWLVQAKDFEDSNARHGRTIRSQAWPQWIETAHLIAIKTLIAKFDLSTAELRLRRLTRSAAAGGNSVESEAPPSASDAQNDPLFEKMAWPSRQECTPQTWYELGNLLAKKREGQVEAVKCFHKAIELSNSVGGSPTSIAAKLALARCYLNLDRSADASRTLLDLQSQQLTPDQQIQLCVIQFKIQRADQSVQRADPSDSHSENRLVPAVALATSASVSASTYHELVAALLWSSLHSEAIATSKKLIEVHPDHPLSQESRAFLARQYAEQGGWSDSLHWANELLNFVAPPPIINYALYMKGKALRHLERESESENTLNQILTADSLAKNLEVAIRLELTDMHYQSERWHELPDHLNWLEEHGKLLQVTPEWYPTILLRQAEMFASKSAWKEAESLVSGICEKFPEWEKAPEAEYLLARCFVAKAEFDLARKLLEQILHRSPDQVSSTLAARAGWMTGETFMMQRKYTDAVVSYQRVLTIPREPYWHAASAFQIGQCAEHCQDLEAAEEWYRKVQTDYAEYPFAKNADERLKHLSSSSTKQAERIGSGKKR